MKIKSQSTVQAASAVESSLPVQAEVDDVAEVDLDQYEAGGSLSEQSLEVGGGAASSSQSVFSWMIGRTTPQYKYYEGKDLGITAAEQAALDAEDLQAFWGSRLGKDPVARIGLGIWGAKEELAAGLEKYPEDYWKPNINPASAIPLRFQMSSDLPLVPETKDELANYWTWVGKDAREHVERFVEKEGLIRGAENPKEAMDQMMKKVGLAIARHHAAFVQADIAEGTGEIPGLLSRKQIADYHHDALKEFELPPEAYGGTPIRWLPDAFELWAAGGLYAPDADPSSES